jgi:hypothetical protein
MSVTVIVFMELRLLARRLLRRLVLQLRVVSNISFCSLRGAKSRNVKVYELGIFEEIGQVVVIGPVVKCILIK